ncbi:MAG TPA: hypothetical protein VLC46_21185 [Thermoanaerobaculia bacterium]|nr:hypothetical protein [Thermoanaerobaculia bacterium]
MSATTAFEQNVGGLRHREEAAGCVASTLICGGSDSGELAPGDCTFSDGTRYDVWQFAGSAGQLITVTMKPLDASYTTPILELVPPAGDASKTPLVLGVPPLEIAYELASSGIWTVAVETNDLFASGRYSISLQCATAQPGAPQNCVYQPLSCNQSYDWFVTASSCQFSGGGWAFAPFHIKLTQGDYVSFSSHSDAYDPAVAVYQNGGQPLTYNYGHRSTVDATVYFTTPATATYDIAIYGATAQSAGEFFMASNCIAVCGPPTISSQPVSRTVPYGGSATVTIAATSPNGNPTTYSWYSDDGGLPVSIGSGTSFTLSNVTTTRRLYAQAQSPCGSVTSSVATITPLAPPRGRAVRH